MDWCALPSSLLLRHVGEDVAHIFIRDEGPDAHVTNDGRHHFWRKFVRRHVATSAIRAEAFFALDSHGPVFRRDNRILQKAIDRLTEYQYRADFGTCAIAWPLLDEWEADVIAGKLPDFSKSK